MRLLLDSLFGRRLFDRVPVLVPAPTFVPVPVSVPRSVIVAVPIAVIVPRPLRVAVVTFCVPLLVAPAPPA